MSAIQLDSEALNALVVKSIVDSISVEQREQFIAAAVADLIKPRKPLGGDWRTPETTPLHDAFARAVQAATNRIAQEMVEQNAEFQQRLRTMIAETMAGAVGEGSYNYLREKIGEAVRTAVVDALSRVGP